MLPVIEEARPGGASSSGIELTVKPKAPLSRINAAAMTSRAKDSLAVIKSSNAMPAPASMIAAVAKT